MEIAALSAWWVSVGSYPKKAGLTWACRGPNMGLLIIFFRCTDETEVNISSWGCNCHQPSFGWSVGRIVLVCS